MTDPDADAIEISVLGRIADIPAEDWDLCACPETTDGRPVDPFTTHRFLSALETSGSVGTGTGWQPQHLVARAEGEVIGVAPLYANSHSQDGTIRICKWLCPSPRPRGGAF